MFSSRKGFVMLFVLACIAFFSSSAYLSLAAGDKKEQSGKKGEATLLRILFGDTPDWTLLEDNIDSFYAKYPDITVDLTYMSHKEMVEKVSMELASGSSTYDVVYIDNFGLPQLAAAGWLQPQNEYIAESGFDLSDFGEGLVEALSYEGNIYSPPYYAETLVYYFRKDLFDEYGVKKVPDTFAEMLDVAKKLTLDTNNDGKTDVYGMVQRGDKFYGYVCYTYAAILKGYGSDWFDREWNPIFNNARGLEAAKVFADMMRNYAPPGVATYGWHEALADFNQGRAAQYQDASPFGPRMQDPDESAVAGKVGYSVALKGPAARVPGMYTAGHAINVYSKNKEAAWKFVDWTVSSEINKLVSNPSRFSTLEDPAIVEKFSIGPAGYQFLDAWVEGLKYAQSPFPSIPEWPEVGDRIGAALNRIIIGSDIKKELDSAAKDVSAIMKSAGYYK
jgi:ABC-type glycerol-3-phosphate transport system substrate-binding protein